MSNETDLDWLARNVHVWKYDSAKTISYDQEDGMAKYGDGMHFKKFTKDQWLSRRAELQNKPRFADHPDAKCFVQNDSGTWFKNRNSTNVRPESYGGWFDRDMSCGWTQLGSGEVLGSWRDTLEKRPEEFKQFTSIEDNQEQDMTNHQEMKQDNKWFERGELPPVDAMVMHMGTATDEDWLEVEIIAHTQRGGFKVAVFEYPGGVSFSSAKCFRPIRTEREVAIEEMQSDIAERWANCEELAKYLVDKGWVKAGK